MLDDKEKIIRELLNKRGIVEESDIIEFLSEKPTKTYDPFLLLHLEAGVDFLLSAIKKGDKICIYGDYDCDGITSVALMMQILSPLTDKLEYYIPSRFDEGYGLNKEAIGKIHAGGAKVILTVDCGSVSVEEVELVKQLGMDIIITDHHNIGDRIPDCLLINPKQPNCPYPFKELAGCGIAFKMAQGIQIKAGLPKSVLAEILDLVCIGTIGDVVPLIDENRTLAKYGLQRLNSTKRPGLIQLIQETGLHVGEVRSENIAYVIVPHINSAGRISKPEIAVEMLISGETAIYIQGVESLLASNRERKKLQEETYQNCLSIIEEHEEKPDFMLVYAEGAHEGITGIVAGKIKDKYERPSIIVTQSGENGEYLKGTGRSISSVDIHKLLKGTEEIFDKFGGHSGACGFLMKKEKLEVLRKYLEQAMAALYLDNPELFILEKQIDYVFSGKEIDIPLIREIDRLSPFGHSNEKPYFRIDHVRIDKCYFMGATNSHVRFNGLCQDGTTLTCILFGEASRYASLLLEKKEVSIYGAPDINTWNGSTKIQFVVHTIKC